jgi:hypothetical protein
MARSYLYWDYQQEWLNALSFKIIKVATPGYSILIILSRLQTYQIVFLKPYLLIENSYIY